MTNDVNEGTMPKPADESPWYGYLLLAALAVLLVIGMMLNHGAKTFDPDNPTVNYLQWRTLLGVLVTLGIFSILYRENPIYRFLEHIFIGLATGYSVAYLWFNFVESRWFVPMMPSTLIHKTQYHEAGQGLWWYFFAFLIGLLFFSVYIPKLAWMNRLVIGVMLGYVSGAAFSMFMGIIAPQITSSFKPPITHYNPGNPPPAGLPFDANNIQLGSSHWYLHPFAVVFLVVLVCTLAYFFFSVEHRNAWMRKPSNVGRYLIMIMLGTIFGTTVMGRFSLLIARLEFLIEAFKGWWLLIFK